MSQPDPNEASRFLIAGSQGPREEQQDSGICLHNDTRGTALLVVGDGVGGRSGGRLASQKVTEVAAKLWEERQGHLAHPEEDLAKFCQAAHEHINSEGSRLGLTPRTTIVALYVTPTHAYWVHSGDSRLYHFRAGELIERTEDHSLLEIMVQRGAVKEEDMGSHPDQGTLLQSLGGEEYAEPSTGHAEITSDDAFLLCTDGFWERTKQEEMLQLAFAPRADAGNLLTQAIERAVERNGPRGDNVTAALALPARKIGVPNRLPGSSPGGSKMRLGLWIGAAILLLLGLVLLFWLSGKKHAVPTSTPEPKASLVAPPASPASDRSSPSRSA
jgi:serine/threonine protein phosphatase PrpC